MIKTDNEFGVLNEIIVGTATNAHWPIKCPVFRSLEQSSSWQGTPLPAGCVDQDIVQEANQSLDHLASILRQHEVKVHRPKSLDFASFDGLYNYCPRDRVLIVGSKIIDAPMLYPTRRPEIHAIEHLLDDEIITPPKDKDIIFDAANICRVGNDLLYLVSSSGSLEGAKWLQRTLGCQYKVHILQDIYSGVHIDSTISIVRPGLAVINSDRITKNNIPDLLRSWDLINVSQNDIVEQSFKFYPFASNYIALNFLSLNESTIVCDPKQDYLRGELSRYGINTIGVDLPHSRTLGGGHHCVTLDLNRS